MTANSPKGLTKNKDKSFTLNIEVSRSDINRQYLILLKKITHNFEYKGFRKGKVPLDIVRQNVDFETIVPDLMEQILSPLYRRQLELHKLRPIAAPKIVILNPPLTLDKNWQLKLSSWEKPEVKIADEILKKAADINRQKHDDKEREHQLVHLLLDLSQVELPQPLIDDEINYRLSKLIDQLSQAGLTVNQYLAGRKTNLDDLKKQYADDISREWRLNLAFDRLAADQKITVSEKDVDKLIVQHGLPPDSDRRQLLAQVSLQQKVLDFLKSID